LLYALLVAAFATATVMAQPLAARAETPSSVDAFLSAYRCPVVDRLEQVYAGGDQRSDFNRYIAVTVPEHPHGYVQCIFGQHRTKLLCEASSGYYYSKRGEPRTFRLQPEALAALARLGFSSDDTAGNFQREFDVAGVPDFKTIADFMLMALHNGYGARAETRLRFNAPFARTTRSKCVPLS
jgi:hypothetical protein